MLTRQTKEQEKTSSVRPRRDPEASGPQAAAQTRSFFRLPAAAPPVVQMMPRGAGRGWENLNLSTQDRRLAAGRLRQTGLNAITSHTTHTGVPPRVGVPPYATFMPPPISETLTYAEPSQPGRLLQQTQPQIVPQPDDDTVVAQPLPPWYVRDVQRQAWYTVMLRDAPESALALDRICIERERIQPALPGWYTGKSRTYSRLTAVQKKPWYVRMLCSPEIEKIYALDKLCIDTDQMVGGLNDPGRKALASYVGWSFKMINSYFRGSKIYSELEPKDQELIRLIELIQPSFPIIRRPITVYRGAKSIMGGDNKLYNKEELKTRMPLYVVEQGLLSTSLNWKHALLFAGDGILLKITVPAGVPALFVTEKVENRVNAGKLRDEDEIIFQTGRRMRIKGTGEKGDCLVLFVEMEPR